MENKVIEIEGEEEQISLPASRVVEKSGEKMRQNAVATVEHRAVMTPMEMIGRALEMGVSADILKQMMDLRDREDAKLARKAFDEAISQAKSKMTPVIKNATGHNNKRYADFSAVSRMVDPILSEFGLSYRFKTTQNERITVTCVLSHKDGHCEETTLSAPADTTGNKNAIQAIGSTITYLSRYSLMASLGLSASDDDDGKSAGGTEVKFITEKQVMEIRDLIDEVGADEKKFLAVGKIDRLEDILANQYDDAVAMLKRKRAAA